MNLVLLVLVIFLSGCNYKSTKSGALILTPTTQSINSFDLIKTNILDAKCLRCHSGASAKAGADLSSYASIMSNPRLVTAGNSATSKLFTEVDSGSMPLGSAALATKEIKSIQDWINSGAPDGEFAANTPVPSIPELPPVPTPPVTPAPQPPIPEPPISTASYSEVQTKIFNQSCLRCHSGESAAANINLESYELLMAGTNAIEPGKATASLVYTDILSGRMPLGGAKITPELTELLKNWIDQGAANN